MADQHQRGPVGAERAARSTTRVLRRLGLHPETWAGLAPNGIGQQKPHHLREMAEVALANRHDLPYAWKVLRQGVCDGCALGVAGLHDWTLDGIHLCTTRLRLLELNTAPVLDHDRLRDSADLARQSSTELRALGRLGYPMLRRRGERGFRRIEWDDALALVAQRVQATHPDRTGWYLTSRGLTNETYYTAGKAVRAIGTNNLDSAARVCHAPSSVGLVETIGVAASTCSLQDVLETDLVVLWGTNPANNQPVFMKYLDRAVKRGARVVVVNPYLEPGLERYWVPSLPESYLFGTRIAHLHVPVRPGGDVALANLVLRRLDEWGEVDRTFVAEHTTGWDEAVAAAKAQPEEALLAASGLAAEVVDTFARTYAAARRSVLIWSMGITQHDDGVDGVRAIVNLALARGHLGRDGSGLMPIRGHSGVQGGAEMGAYATAFPGQRPIDADSAVELGAVWGFDVPATPGLTAPQLIDAAARGSLDVLWSSGGNFVDVLPDPRYVAEAMGNVPLRVHADIVLTPQMFVEGDEVLILPVRTRYEQEGGGTSTTTERRVAYSPEIPREVGEARSEWRLYADVACAVRPDLCHAFAWPDGAALREEIARVVPSYAGIETLRVTGDAIQWGGRHLCPDGECPTPDGRARFTPLAVRSSELAPGEFHLSMRRGKQFNSMRFAEIDPLTGATRDAVYLDRRDAAALGVADGDAVLLHNGHARFSGTAKVVDLPRHTVQVHWPEGNVLLAADPGRREPRSGIPDYTTIVRVERCP